MPDQTKLSQAKRSLLEKYLRGEMPGSPEGQNRITPRETGAVAPLSLSQQQVWLHHHIVPDDVPAYNETLTIHRTGPLNVAALERTLAEIIRRHEIWRTTFDVFDGQPAQIIHPDEPSFKLTLINLDNLPEAERGYEAARLAREDAVKAFDLKSGPLMRAMLVRLGEDQHRLFMAFHQLIFDGVTAYQVFLPELAQLYQAFSQNKPSPLPEPRTQYADYAIWQQDWMKRESIAAQMAYWQNKLAGELPVLDWPDDRPRPALQSYRGEIERATFSAEVLRKLKAIGQREGASLFMTLVAGLSALLHRYTGQDDIILGAPTAGRKIPELQRMLGYFLNVMPLRIDLSGDPTFRELVKRVRGTVLEALSNEDVPFAQLIEKLRPTLDPSRNPLFQIAISVEPPAALMDMGWSATQSDIPTGASKLDLYIDVDDRPDGLVGPVTYNPDVFERGTIIRMIEHWRVLLEGAAANPERRLSELPVLTADEKRCILHDWNETRAEYPSDKCIHEIFDAQCERTPDALAVREGERSLTFRQLQERSNRLAHYLRSLGAGPDSRIALQLERSLDMVVGLLAILKTGGAYVPLDPSHPPKLLAFILQDPLCLDVADVSIPSRRGLLPEDESGICGFGVGDIRAVAGWSSQRDHSAGNGARSGRAVAGAGAGASDADGDGALAVAELARSCAQSAGEGTGVEAVDVQWGGVFEGTGGAFPGSVSRGPAAESVRIVGGGGRCDLARSHQAGWNGTGSHRQADQQHADLRFGRAFESGTGGSAGADLC